VWILQTLPSVVIGLYTRWFHRWALLAGWAVGMGIGTWMAQDSSFKTSVYALNLFGWHFSAYEAVFGLVANLLVAVGLTSVFRLAGARDRARDETRPEDYSEFRRAPARPTAGLAH
jgi:solute:Na+ symporter, SSS family